MSNINNVGTGYYRKVVNTALSGQSLIASLSGNDLTSLLFDQKVTAANTAVNLGSGAQTAVLSTDQLVAATNDKLLINLTSVATGVLSLGPDAASTAAAYVQLFNLQSTSDVRELTFQLANLAMTATSGVVAGTVSLQSGTTFNNVVVGHSGLAGTGIVDYASGAACTLFNLATGPGSGTVDSGNVAGLKRNVLVSALSLTSGSQVVLFDILDGSL